MMSPCWQFGSEYVLDVTITLPPTFMSCGYCEKASVIPLAAGAHAGAPLLLALLPVLPLLLLPWPPLLLALDPPLPEALVPEPPLLPNPPPLPLALLPLVLPLLLPARAPPLLVLPP